MTGQTSPPISAHRLLGGSRSVALVTHDGEVDWWCAPEPDDEPVLWSLLDPKGPAARWVGARFAGVDGPPAGPVVDGSLIIDAALVETRDALVEVEGFVCLARLVRSTGATVRAVHAVSAGEFGKEPRTPRDSAIPVGELALRVVGSGSITTTEGRELHTEVEVGPGQWAGIVLALGAVEQAPPAWSTVLVEIELERERAHEERSRARPPRRHPDRALDALAVLGACTYQPSGAVMAAATTSLPEAIGGTRQFDYRYSWMRDSALAMSVASLLGQRAGARRYLGFVEQVTSQPEGLGAPVANVRGGAVPSEREVDIRGWHDSRPVRVGNEASEQVQFDAWGMVVEAISVHLQTGGSLSRDAWSLVRRIADQAATDTSTESNGIWEFRYESDLLSADIGRWLALDRAMRIGLFMRPFTSRSAWRAARTRYRDRVIAALLPDGGLPQAHDDPDSPPDASALMAVVFGMFRGDDPRARRLVDATLRDLGAGPYMYRYPPNEDDGFKGIEATFLPMAWWAVAALAITGRVKEARERADDLCARLPRLLSEEVDARDGTSLGNVPLVWSHMELARALYILDACELRERFGRVALTAWRVHRYALLRWRTPSGDDA